VVADTIPTSGVRSTGMINSTYNWNWSIHIRFSPLSANSPPSTYYKSGEDRSEAILFARNVTRYICRKWPTGQY